MKKIFYLLPLAVMVSCQEKPIYENSSYSMFSDRIVQGEYTGVAESPNKIVSNLDGEEYVWEKKNDLSAYPTLETPYLIEEAAFNIGLDESINAVEPDGTLRTGLEWGGVWTRDVSYSIIHSMSYIQTEAAKTSLMCKVNSKGEIIQDTGTGGACIHSLPPTPFPSISSSKKKKKISLFPFHSPSPQRRKMRRN